MEKRKKVTRIVIWALIIGMILPLFVGIISSYSVTQSQVNSLKKQRDEITAKRKEAEQSFNSLKNEISETMVKKQALDEKMALTNEEIEVTEALIEALDGQIAEKNLEIDLLLTEEAELNEKFRMFLRDYYENGNSSYIEILLTADSFGDFLMRLDMVKLIMSSDKKLITAIESNRERQENIRASLQTDLDDAVTLKAELGAFCVTLENDLEEVALLMANLYEQEAESSGLLDEIQAKYESIEKEYNDAAKELEKQRKAELARLADEQRKKAEADALQYANGSKTFMWPTPGYTYITSKFGNRTHPITKQPNFHTGVDIGVPYGNKIYATAGGTVIANEYNSIMGYLVRIDHGNGFISVYGHMNKKSALAVGSQVKTGDIVGYVGSTGSSTGPHLHFSLYKNGTLVDPLKYVTPK